MLHRKDDIYMLMSLLPADILFKMKIVNKILMSESCLHFTLSFNFKSQSCRSLERMPIACGSRFVYIPHILAHSIMTAKQCFSDCFQSLRLCNQLLRPEGEFYVQF